MAKNIANQKLRDDMKIRNDLWVIGQIALETQTKNRLAKNQADYDEFMRGYDTGSFISTGIKNPMDKYNGKKVSVEFRMGMIAGLANSTITINGLNERKYPGVTRSPLGMKSKSILEYVKILSNRISEFIFCHKGFI